MRLTYKQLHSSEDDLEAMIREIRAELDRRYRDRREEERADSEDLGGGKGGYQWQMVRCRKSCACNGGKGHGPYLYRHFRSKETGKMTSEYIGMKHLDAHPTAPPRPAPEDAVQLKPRPAEKQGAAS